VSASRDGLARHGPGVRQGPRKLALLVHERMSFSSVSLEAIFRGVEHDRRVIHIGGGALSVALSTADCNEDCFKLRERTGDPILFARGHELRVDFERPEVRGM